MIFSDYLVYEYLYNSPSPAIGNAADIAAHKRTIQEAIDSGVDGFQLDYYNDNGAGPLQFNIISNMLEAAKELHDSNPFRSPFLLFLAPALAGGGVNQTYGSTGRNWVEYFVASFYTHPNYFNYSGKPVLGSFMGLDQQTDLTNLVFTPLANEGIHVFYVPSVNNASQVTTDGTHFTAWAVANIGSLHIWSGNTPTNDIAGTNAIVAVNVANSVPNVVGVSVAPFMDTHSGGNAPYFEHFGGEGPDAEYQNAISTNPVFVIESPWNDLVESYSSPIDVTLPTVISGYSYDNLLKPHRGYSEIRKYYAQWLKTGIKPAITQDFVAYFYRTSPYAANNNPSNPAPWNVEGTTPPDNVYVTCDLVSAATLQINTGGTITTYNLGAGRNLVHTPFTPGATQNFQIIRSGVKVATVSGEPIIANPTQNNLQSTSGFYRTGVTMAFPTATVTQGSGLTINTLPNAGQSLMMNSLGVAIASDQSPIPVISLASGAVTNPTSVLTRSALLTSGNVTVSTSVSPYFTWTTAPSNPLVNGQGVYLGGTTVPSSFTANVTYYVRDVAGNTFNLSSALGGPAIVPASAGTAVTATMQYKGGAVGDIIASSAIAGSVAVPFFTLPNTAGGVIFSRIRLVASLVGFSWQGVNLSINLWSAAPTYTNGDAQAYAVATGGANWIANFLVTMTQFGDAAIGAGQLTGANEAALKLASGTSVYWDLQILSYVGTAPSQTFTLIPELLN